MANILGSLKDYISNLSIVNSGESTTKKFLKYGGVLSSLFALFRLYKVYKTKTQLRLAQKIVQTRMKEEINYLNEIFTTIGIKEESKKILDEVKYANEITALISKGSISCLEVVLYFSKKIVEAQKKNNCLTVCCFREAIEEAKKVDGQILNGEKSGGKNLQGLTFSIKDCLNLKGYDTSIGLSGSVNKPSKENNVLVDILIEKGAIPLVKTAIPQSLLTFECLNPLYGLTTHPQFSELTCGGSSGGEAVVLSTRGSLVGIGTDIGGSVRIPASWCGIVGLKPTSRRISRLGTKTSVVGQEGIPGVIGPMGRNVDDLILLMENWIGPQMWSKDHSCVPLPWDKDILESKIPLKIGYYTTDGFIDPAPCFPRAIKDVVKRLEDLGHSVVPWTPPNVEESIFLFYQLLSSDGAKTHFEYLEYEVVSPMLKSIIFSISLNYNLKRVIGFFLSMFGEARLAKLLNSLKEISVMDLWKLQGKRNDLRQQMYESWKKEDIDIVICPSSSLPAPPNGTFSKASWVACYTMLYNFYDYPAGVVPVSTLKSTDVFSNDKKLDVLEQRVRNSYDPVKYEGIPVAVQVVGLPFEEEKVIRVMKEIESSFN